MKTLSIQFLKLVIGLTLMLGWSCREEYDFEKLSGVVLIDPEIDAPIVRGSLTAADLFASWDSLMENNGDTVVLAFRDDSLIYFTVSEFSGIPPQETSEFNLISSSTYPELPVDSLVIDSIAHYGLHFVNGMRLDSVFISEGALSVEVSSSFRHTGTLDINCPEVFEDGQQFHKRIQISSASGLFAMDTLFPLTNARIYINNSIPNDPYIRNIYHLVLHKNPGQGVDAGDKVQIHFSIVDLHRFDAAFGFAGNDIYSEDTIFNTGLDAIKGLTGTFSITDPRIDFEYVNSYGIPIGLDLSILGYFKEGKTVNADPAMQVTIASDDYQHPEVTGSLHFNRTTIPNIDELLSFPVADSLSVEAEAGANPGATNATNFILKNSSVQVGIDVKVPLAFKADLQMRDTFKVNIEKPEQIDFVEYAKLHYRIRNEFPVNLYPYIILYDSVADVNRDTLLLSASTSDPFIKAAPVDANGITITGEVDDYTGSIDMDKELMDHFFKDSNKLIFAVGFSSYDKKNVVILTTYKFDFRCNLEAKIHYLTNFNDNNKE
jgi:hypothetical protein